MVIEVNGASREVPDGATIARLLDSLELPATGVAVAVDRKVVPRSDHEHHTLTPGAKVEILRAVGGG